MVEGKSSLNNQGEPKLLLNRYRIEERIGCGPFATVYKAADMELRGALVAIKSVHPHLLASETIQKELRSRVLAMRQLVHANILKSFDLEEDEQGMLHLITEYCDGWSLAELLSERKGKQLKREAVFHILKCIADALSYAHQKGVLHLDLKPENILITKEGEIKVSDFSFSQAFNEADGFTRTGEAVSNPAYMAPEQFALGETGVHTDMYSWAVIGYQISTGNSDFTKQSYLNCARTHMSGELVNMFETQVLDTPLESILEKASCLEPDKRFKTTKELCDSIALISPNTQSSELEFRKTLTSSKKKKKPLVWKLFIPGGIIVTAVPLIVWTAQIDFKVPLYAGILQLESYSGTEFSRIKETLEIPYTVDKPDDIFKAIASDNYKAAYALYKLGIDGSLVNEEGDTALHYHLRKFPQTFPRVLRYEEKLETLNKKGESLLHVAFSNETALTLMSALLESGINPDTVNKDGFAALHLAILRHDNYNLKLLLSHHASPNVRAPNGLTPIMLALQNFANQETLYQRIRILIKFGAQVRAYDNYAKSTLDYIEGINIPKIEKLIRKHWDIESSALEPDKLAGDIQ